jgi:hypothetical protein
MVAVRVMLDTNLWSWIGDEDVARPFDALMTARGFEVVVAPSTPAGGHSASRAGATSTDHHSHGDRAASTPCPRSAIRVD